MSEVSRFDSDLEAAEVTLRAYTIEELDEVVIARAVRFHDPMVMGGIGIEMAIPLRIKDWPALRAAIDEMLAPPVPSKDAALHRAMRKT